MTNILSAISSGDSYPTHFKPAAILPVERSPASAVSLSVIN